MFTINFQMFYLRDTSNNNHCRKKGNEQNFYYNNFGKGEKNEEIKSGKLEFRSFLLILDFHVFLRTWLILEISNNIK